METPPEPWIERVIREAAEAGAFDEPAGSGERIPDLDRPYRPGWWAKRWLERERAAEQARKRSAEMRREAARALVDEREAAAGTSSVLAYICAISFAKVRKNG